MALNDKILDGAGVEKLSQLIKDAIADSGGGGTAYSAGSGIEISNATIYANPRIQPLLGMSVGEYTQSTSSTPAAMYNALVRGLVARPGSSFNFSIADYATRAGISSTVSVYTLSSAGVLTSDDYQATSSTTIPLQTQTFVFRSNPSHVYIIERQDSSTPNPYFKGIYSRVMAVWDHDNDYTLETALNHRPWGNIVATESVPSTENTINWVYG